MQLIFYNLWFNRLTYTSARAVFRLLIIHDQCAEMITEIRAWWVYWLRNTHYPSIVMEWTCLSVLAQYFYLAGTRVQLFVK